MTTQPLDATRGDRRLSLALLTWSRRQRRDSGAVVVDTARDLIDAGGSANREALDLAKTGLVLRARGVVRDARRAPWQAAAPLVLLAAAVLWVGLTVADAGGWSQVLSRDDAGAALIVVLSILLAGLALTGRRWLTVPTLGAIAALYVGWTSSGDHLGHRSALLETPVRTVNGYAPEQIGITMYGVVGLLLAAAGLTALAWAITGTLGRRRTGADAAAPPAERRSSRHAALLGAVAFATMLGLPRAAVWLRDAADAALGTSDVSTAMWGDIGDHTLWLLVATIAVVFASALVLPRRAPAATLALTVLAAALWIPALWLLTGVLRPGLPFAWFVSEDAAILLDWAVLAVAGTGVGAWTVARAGRAAAAQPGASTPPADPPPSGAGAPIGA